MLFRHSWKREIGGVCQESEEDGGVERDSRGLKCSNFSGLPNRFYGLRAKNCLSSRPTDQTLSRETSSSTNIEPERQGFCDCERYSKREKGGGRKSR